MPDDAPWTDPVTVPDDLRELQADIDAYHREQRHAARRRRIDRITTSRAFRRWGVPTVITAGALTLATLVFAVLTFGRPGPQLGPVRAPVAASAAAVPGVQGGLLPDVTVRTGAGQMPIRELRPALVALVPLHCNCAAVMSALAGQAEEVSVSLVVVAPAAGDAEVDALPGQVHVGHVVPVFDAGGVLARSYHASGVTALVVAPDALVTYVARDVTAQTRLEFTLQQMVTTTT